MKPSDKNPPSEAFLGAILRGYDKEKARRGVVTPADIWNEVVRECLTVRGGFTAMFSWDKTQSKSDVNRIGTIMDCISGGVVPGLCLAHDKRGKITVEKVAKGEAA